MERTNSSLFQDSQPPFSPAKPTAKALPPVRAGWRCCKSRQLPWRVSAQSNVDHRRPSLRTGAVEHGAMALAPSRPVIAKLATVASDRSIDRRSKYLQPSYMGRVHLPSTILMSLNLPSKSSWCCFSIFSFQEGLLSITEGAKEDVKKLWKAQNLRPTSQLRESGFSYNELGALSLLLLHSSNYT